MAKMLQVQRFMAVMPSGCCVAITQTIAYFFGHLLLPNEAAELINFDPGGQTLKVAARKLSKFKIKHKWLGTIKKIEKFIDSGFPVASGDDGRYFGPHSILIIGYNENNFYLADPNRADVQIADKQKLFNNSDEFYGVFK